MALSTFGQRPTEPTSTFKVTPHSPTAAALGKYVDLPVSLATGTPQINIPLYEIKSGELTLPISLTYQATGFRVGERAGWTGLGWSLNAGGVVSRTIRDKKDDGSFERPSQSFGWGNYQVDTPKVNNPTDYRYLNGLMDSGILPDGQPDMFSFSFPGHSGKFIRPTWQSIQLLPIQPLDVSFSGQEPSINSRLDMAKWTIVDEKGQIFEFEATELNERPHGKDVSSWFLTRMTSASGRDVITFEYSEPHEYTMSVVQSETHVRSLSGLPVRQDRDVSMPFKMFTRHLKAIRFAEGSVEFIASTRGRDDVPGEVKLESMVVRHRDEDAMRRFDLTYSQARNPAERMQLTSLTESYVEGKHLTHHFTYHATRLPHPESLVQDHWGFFNRNLEGLAGISYDGLGGSLIPSDMADLVNLDFQLRGLNRSPDGKYGQADMLTRITYPTGGYAAFAYEGHDYDGPRVFETRREQVVTAQATYSSGPDPRYTSPWMGYANGTSPTTTRPSVIQRFTVPITATNVEVETGVHTSSTNTNPRHWTAISIRLADDGTDDITAERFSRLPEEYSSTRTSTAPVRVELTPGQNYAIKCMAETEGTVVTATVSATVPTETYSLPQAGGVRVRAITLHDGISHANDIVKQYSYRSFSNPLRSSGAINGMPKYVNRFLDKYEPQVGLGDPIMDPLKPDLPVWRLMITASSQSTLGGGAHIFYKQVEETIDGGSGGRSRYEYVGTRRGPGGYGYPHVPGNDSSRQAPLLIQQTDFNATGDKVREVQYRYRTLPALNKLTRGYGLVMTPKANLCRGTLPELFPDLTRFIPVKPFVMFSEFEYLAETKEYRYGTSPGQQSQLSISRTYYENPQHLQPTRMVQVTTPQDSLVTITQYPTDYATATPADEPSRALVGLRDEHRLATVVEQLQWRVRNGQSQLVSATLQHFKSVPLRPAPRGHRPFILPARTYALRAATPLASTDFVASTITDGTFRQSAAYQEVLRYEQYDSKANPTLVRSPQDAPSCLLWSDAGRRVLAEVKNALPGYAAYTSFEPLALGGWKYPVPAALAAHRQGGGRTGLWAYRLAESTQSVGLDSLPAATYLLSFWATGRPVLVLNGAQRPPLTSADVVATAPGNWACYQVRLSAPALTSLFLNAQPGQEMLLDELRLHPVDAQMTTYTYDPVVGMNSQTDPTGRTLTYEYDALGRLQRVRDEKGRVLSEQEYHLVGRPN
jgi:YD repeat-containing protein